MAAATMERPRETQFIIVEKCTRCGVCLGGATEAGRPMGGVARPKAEQVANGGASREEERGDDVGRIVSSFVEQLNAHKAATIEAVRGEMESRETAIDDLLCLMEKETQDRMAHEALTQDTFQNAAEAQAERDSLISAQAKRIIAEMESREEQLSAQLEAVNAELAEEPKQREVDYSGVAGNARARKR